MALVRSSRPLSLNVLNSGFFDGFDRVFSELSYANNPSPYPVDFYETEDSLVLELAVPGFTSNDLDISLENHYLSIKAQPAKEQEDTTRQYWLNGKVRREFKHKLKLPKRVDTDNIEAKVQNGILRLSLPKLAEAKLKKITVS